MNPIAHYTPGIVVAGVLEIAGGIDSATDWEDFIGMSELLVKLVARDLAALELTDGSVDVVTSNAAMTRRATVRYYEDAPETKALVMRLLQVARTEWMRDPW